MTRNRKWWWTAVNVLIGAPGGFVFFFTAIGLQGFMGPPTRKGQTAAVTLAAVYLLIWLLANAFLLRDVAGRRRFLWFGASLLVMAASAFAFTFVVLQLKLLS